MIKTVYEHIHFVIVGQKPRTTVWECRNNVTDERLAEIGWYSPWRKYCVLGFEPGKVFDNTCLAYINHFLDQLNKPENRKVSQNE